MCCIYGLNNKQQQILAQNSFKHINLSTTKFRIIKKNWIRRRLNWKVEKRNNRQILIVTVPITFNEFTSSIIFTGKQLSGQIKSGEDPTNCRKSDTAQKSQNVKKLKWNFEYWFKKKSFRFNEIRINVVNMIKVSIEICFFFSVFYNVVRSGSSIHI